MYISQEVSNAIIKATQLAKEWKHEYVTSEHILLAMCDEKIFKEAFESCDGDCKQLKEDLTEYLQENMETSEEEPIESFSLQQAIMWAGQQVLNSGKDQVELDHLLSGIMNQPESYSTYYIEIQGITLTDLLYEMCHMIGDKETKQLDAHSGHLDSNEETQESEEGYEAGDIGKLSKYVTNLNELVKRAHKCPADGW